MTLVAGVDSSTQSCKVVVCDAGSGSMVRAGRAPHPPGTEVDPEEWWRALQTAISQAGGLDDVAAVSVAGQQHGMICLDADRGVIRPALLWNDTRSADAAEDLRRELGEAAWAEAVGTVPVASLTVTKLRWLAEHEPEHAARTAAVCLPHDWLTWRLAGARSIERLVTDRGDASGTGYWSPTSGTYRPDLLERALGAVPLAPRVAAPSERCGETSTGTVLGPGTGDNMGAALGVGAAPGTVVVSIGTSGVVSAVSATPTADPSGLVAGFADATGRYLPLACTLNGSGVLEATARLLGVDLARLADLALSAPSGAEGLVLVPYLAGERTPDRPHATGALHGLGSTNLSPSNVARAAVEGLLCGLADGLDALVAAGAAAPERVVLVGGGARSGAVAAIAPEVFGLPVDVPLDREHVAVGAARQAAWVLAGGEPPAWGLAEAKRHQAPARSDVRERYAEVRDLHGNR